MVSTNVWLVPAAAAGFAAAITLLLGARGRYAHVLITGSSMEPTYHDGDRILVRRLPHQRFRVGDVVVIECPDDRGSWSSTPPGRRDLNRIWMIKRVMALPGDPVPRALVPALTTVPEEFVPPGQVVVLGDAGRRSYDSKHVGYFPMDRVLGVALRPAASH
ncbi:signal peptidase I [Micromonospora sp. NPDC048842]|uniref:signal peptidase I n=1 Tax=Micromonospora sp. NPDC048842 TaxID=3154346 RepID=UPI0033C3B52D